MAAQRVRSILVLLSIVSSVFINVSSARADEPEDAADDSSEQRLIHLRPAPDSLSGHLIISPRVGYQWSAGSLDKELGQGDVLGSGMGLGLDLSYGLSRYVAWQLGASYATLSPSTLPANAESLDASSLLLTTGLEYHLVDGAGVDPWVSASMGYRTTHVRFRPAGADNNAELDYSGIEWMRVSMGMSWFGTSWLGAGPYLAADLGRYSRRPAGEDLRPGRFEDAPATYMFFSVGLRLTLDPMR